LYAIKMEEDKSLTTTIQSTIYQGDKNADTLVFLIPQKYEENSLADCEILLRYIMPNGMGRSEKLEMYPIPHNKDYYQFRLSVASRFTEDDGDIELWLTAVNFNDDILFRTGTATVTITPHKVIDDYLPPAALNQLDELAAKVYHMELETVNNLKYDSVEETLQLTANGVPVGDLVALGKIVEDMDDVINFGDEETDGGDGTSSGGASSGGNSSGSEDDDGIINF